MKLIEKIDKLRKEKNAIILAHNYQRPEIQDIADYIGDSIELSRKAMEEKEAEIIVFAAVDFMAESAAILNPKKKVLLPSLGARCPMAQMITTTEIKRYKKKYPDVPVVLYVNTLASSKAECDICVYKARCCKSKKGEARTIKTDDKESLREEMREKMEKESSKEIFKKRKEIVEPVFGQIKNMGFRGFSMRGYKKAGGEFSLVCAVHNIKKIVKAITKGVVHGYGARYAYNML